MPLMGQRPPSHGPPMAPWMLAPLMAGGSGMGVPAPGLMPGLGMVWVWACGHGDGNGDGNAGNEWEVYAWSDGVRDDGPWRIRKIGSWQVGSTA